MSSVFARTLAAPSSLNTGLTSLWRMEDAAGANAADAVGSNTMTQVNSPGSATGKIGLARTLVRASTQYFTRASNSGLQCGNNNRTWSFWVNLTDKSNTYEIVTKGDAATLAGSEYELFYSSGSDRFAANFYPLGGGANVMVTANTFGSPTAGVWYLVTAYHDATNDLIGISVNAGAFNTTAFTLGTNVTAAAFVIGAVAAGVVPMNGIIDQSALWSRVLTAAEVTALYNGGAGAPWPFIGMP